MRILVTGGAGFIGSWVVDALVERGHEVICADRSLTWIRGDVRNFELDIINGPRVQSLLQEIKPELTIHLAGILGTTETWDHVHETIDSNIHGAINVYEACGAVGSDILTVDVGSRWLVPYTISKRCGAEFAFAFGNKFGIKAAALRIFNVYGPRQSNKIIKIVPKFIEMALKDSDLEVMGNKNADLVHVRDVAHAFALAAENMGKIDQYDGILVGSGWPITVADVARKIVEKIGSGMVIHRPTRLGEEKSDAGYMQDDSAKRLLGWEPKIGLNDGLDETIAWYREHYR